MKIKWTNNALAQLDRVHAYYAEIDRRLAARIFRSLQQTPRRLSQFPASGRKGREPGTLELVVPDLPFLIVYRETEGCVEIMRVLHTAMNLDTGWA